MSIPSGDLPFPTSTGLDHLDKVSLLDWTVRILVIATEIVTMEEPAAIAQRVADALVEELCLPVVSILLADSAGVLTYAADHGVSDEVKALGFRRDGSAYTAFSTGDASFVEDVNSDGRANPKTRSLMGAYAALPIHHKGRSYGVVMVTFMDKHPFPPIERVTLAAFAHQMGIALDNGRLRSLERQRISFLSAQADLAEALSTTLLKKDVVRIFGETLQNTTCSQGLAVWIEQDHNLTLGFHAGFGSDVRPGLPMAVSRVLAALQGEFIGQIPLENLRDDLGLDPSWTAAAGDLRAFAMPLMCAGALEGLLVFLAAPDSQSFDPGLARAMGDRASLSLHNARLYEESQAAASTDALTGLCNRRAFMASARTLLDAALRAGTPLSLIMLDADHFKVCNDTYGHPVGDRVLVLLAQIIRAQVRPTDLIGRIGGEEFLIALQGASDSAAHLVAERIRRAMEDAWLDLEDQGRIKVPTVSLGISNLATGKTRDLEHLLERADAALYQAKGQGRNRICQWQER